MMRDPIVSVIIPVYNIAKYLLQCLESIVHQSYKNIEIIVIDDGSSDGSGRLCDEFAARDNRISVLHTKNNGLAAARNLGILNAHGSFVFFVDGDDWIELHTLAVLLETIVQSQTDFVAVKYCAEYDGVTVYSKKKEKRIQVYQGDEILTAYINGRFGDVVWNKLYRVTCFSRIRFPENQRYYEDLSTTWRIIKDISDSNGSVAILSEDLIHYRMRKSSISHCRSLKNIHECWIAYISKYEGLPAYANKLISGCIIAIGRMWLYNYSLSELEKEQADVVISEMKNFSEQNYRQIMAGKYSLDIKLTCFISRYSHPLVMGICHLLGIMRISLKATKKRRLYD